MTEAGYVKPGNIVFGTDSHTTTYGCVGAFSSGIGYTEMASILGTGTMWIKVPETIKVVIDGELPANVMSKDVILRLIGDLGADGSNLPCTGIYRQCSKKYVRCKPHDHRKHGNRGRGKMCTVSHQMKRQQSTVRLN